MQVQVQVQCGAGAVEVWWEYGLHGKEETRVTRDTRGKGAAVLGYPDFQNSRRC